MRSICHLLFWVIFGDQPILSFRYEGVCICHLFTRASKLSLLFFFFCEASWISLDVLDNISVFLRASVPSLDRYQIRSVSSGGMTGNEKRERRGMMWDKRPWAKRHWRCNSWRDAFKPPGHRGSLKYCCLIVTVSHTSITAVLPVLFTDWHRLPVETVCRAVWSLNVFYVLLPKDTVRICSGLINCPLPISYR